MKKFIVLSALVAATSTAFVACSSDDDLAQQPKAPETTVEEGTPLKIKVVDATRGTDWSATNPLDKFTLFATLNGATTRWANALGDRGSSPYVSNGTDFNNDGSGNFAPTGTINWEDGTWDFYAISDATFAEEAVPSPGTGTQDAEHLDASPRTFTYTVPTAYADQTDLLVGAAIGKQQSNGDVSIPFYHALARVEKVKVHFKGLMDASLSYPDYKFLIKNITFKNVYTTGKFTFPTTWAAPDGNSWSEPATPGDYTIELVDFDKENGSIKFFEEIEDPTSPGDPSEYIPTGLATATERVTGEPNYFAPSTGSHELPIADEGLYLLPQALSTTVTPTGSNYTLTGPYVELEGFIVVEDVTWSDVADEIADGNYDDAVAYIEQDLSLQPSFPGASGSIPGRSNNYNLTHNAVMGKFYCPITTTLLPNKRYVLYIDLSSTLTLATNGSKVFSAATIKTD